MVWAGIDLEMERNSSGRECHPTPNKAPFCVAERGLGSETIRGYSDISLFIGPFHRYLSTQ